jgi:hypothetical protein
MPGMLPRQRYEICGRREIPLIEAEKPAINHNLVSLQTAIEDLQRK